MSAAQMGSINAWIWSAISGDKSVYKDLSSLFGFNSGNKGNT